MPKPEEQEISLRVKKVKTVFLGRVITFAWVAQFILTAVFVLFITEVLSGAQTNLCLYAYTAIAIFWLYKIFTAYKRDKKKAVQEEMDDTPRPNPLYKKKK